MAFDIKFTQSAADQLRGLKKHEQQCVLDAIAEHLTHQSPTHDRDEESKTAEEE